MSNDDFVPFNIQKADKADFKTIHQEDQSKSRSKFYDLLEKSGIKRRKNLDDNPLFSSGKDPDEVEEETLEDKKNKEIKALRKERKSLDKEAEGIKEEAYNKGFEEGKNEGYQDGLKQARESTERIITIINDMENLWKDQVAANEKEIVDMIIRISEKVIQGKIESDNEIVKNSIFHAFEQMPETKDVTISVNPADYEFIDIVQEDFFKKVEGLKQISIQSDVAIDRGGCKIESKRGEVNSSIEGRISAVKQSIIETHGG